MLPFGMWQRLHWPFQSSADNRVQIRAHLQYNNGGDGKRYCKGILLGSLYTLAATGDKAKPIGRVKLLPSHRQCKMDDGPMPIGCCCWSEVGKFEVGRAARGVVGLLI